MNFCFFTDEKAKRFHPLTLTRPMDDLRVGNFTINEKWKRALHAEIFARIVPQYLSGVFPAGVVSENASCLWINARYLPDTDLLKAIGELKEGEKLIHGEETVAAKVEGQRSAKMHQENNFTHTNLASFEIEDVAKLEYLWDLVSLNASQIEEDLKFLTFQNIEESGLGGEASVEYPENIYVGKNVTIEPGCIFMAEEGPVVIQEGATIEAGSILKGPVAIGEKATVKMQARIYGGSTIGPVCKVGGEVSNTIFHSYSNKPHDGFTGNSVFGQWVNLGADTNTSNLKNNYSVIQLKDWNTHKSIETGLQFLGTIMGDHSKTAINTSLNTGTICGVSSNVFMAGFPPKYIPSFAWVDSADFSVYDFDKAVETMEVMMARRNVALTEAYKKMMHHLFQKREER